MKPNEYRYIYCPLNNLEIVYKTTFAAGNEYMPDINTFKADLNSIVNALGLQISSVEEFYKTLISRYGGWYLCIDTKRIKPLIFNSLATFSFEQNGRNLVLKYSPHIPKIGGDYTGQKRGFASYNLPAGMAENVSKVYCYSDILEFMTEFVGVLVRQLERGNMIAGLYANLPTTNEQYTDETTITPNITTEGEELFNPVGTSSSNDRLRTKNKQTGTQTTVAKRASGVSAKAQADIVRNAPNIFNQCMDEIALLLIDPRTVQDSYDWGLLGNSYVVEEGIQWLMRVGFIRASDTQKTGVMLAIATRPKKNALFYLAARR